MSHVFKPAPPDRATAVDPSPELAASIRVFEGEFDYVFRTLRRLGSSNADAEDLAQEVFLVMWRRRRDWTPGSPLRPWLAAIAYRVTLAHRRRALREVPAGLIDAEDGARAAEEQLASAGVRRLVLDVLDTLPPKQRVVMVMHALDGLSMKQIAQALELPLFTAYSRLRVARQRFAKELRRRQQVSALVADRARVTAKQGVAALPLEALLSAERTLPAVPASIRRRVLGRIEGLPPEGALPGPELPPPGSTPAGTLAPLAALVAAALLLVALIAVSDRADRAAATAALAPVTAETPPTAAPVPAPALPRVPRLRVAAFTPNGGLVDTRAPERLAAGVVGYWRFDETRGTATARDQSGLGVDCVLRRMDSTDWTEGPLGRALRLAGGGWLECPAGAGLRRITSEISVAVWVLRAQRQANLRTIVSRQHGTGRDDDLYLGLVQDRLIFSSLVWGRLEVPIPQELGRWFHVAAVGQADGGLRLYFDGVEIARRGPEPGRALSFAASPEDNPMLVGAANNFLDPVFVDQKLNGSVDELVLYDRALGGPEISQLASGIQPRL